MLPAALNKVPRLLLQPSDLSKAARPATGSRQSISYPWPTPTGSPHTCKSVPVHKRTDTLSGQSLTAEMKAFFKEQLEVSDKRIDALEQREASRDAYDRWLATPSLPRPPFLHFDEWLNTRHS